MSHFAQGLESELNTLLVNYQLASEKCVFRAEKVISRWFLNGIRNQVLGIGLLATINYILGKTETTGRRSTNHAEKIFYLAFRPKR